ncbi:hypothetical protein ACIBSV_48385 [Embleya sp. NPDC050154]|uniref:hypothetical protein n=1 Tax=Embleya sp. NPDC050154 TaxID=3363988 RepID=UPI00378A84E5
MLVLAGSAGCAFMAWWLSERYDELEGPLPEHGRKYPERLALYPQSSLANVEAAQPGGSGLGLFAVAGPERFGDPALASVLIPAGRSSAARIRSRGWTEDQWHRAANARGPLGGPSHLDQARAAPAGYGSPNGAEAGWSEARYAQPPWHLLEEPQG